MLLFIAGTALAQSPDTFHASVSIGNDVAVDTPVTGSVFALGGRLVIDAPVDGNVYGMATTVHITPRGSVSGTLNLVAETLHIEGSVAGLQGAVEVLQLDASVTGDADIVFRALDLGKHGRVDGALSYTTPTRSDSLEARTRGEVRYTVPSSTEGNSIHISFDP